MLLAIDIGNSNIALGVFSGDEIVARAKISAQSERSADEYAAVFYDLLRLNGVDREEVTSCMLSSVVPNRTGLVVDAVRKLASVEPLCVGPGIRTGFQIRIDDPTQLGGDLVADTAAAISEYGVPLILIDAGTVTTIAAIDDRRVYLGGCLLPGIRVSAEVLKSSTALLPSIALRGSKMQNCIGKNTEDAMRAGLLLGNGMAVDGFIDRYMELPHMKGAVCVATGGSAEMVTADCSHTIQIDTDLTLKGLKYLYDNQSGKR